MKKIFLALIIITVGSLSALAQQQQLSSSKQLYIEQVISAPEAEPNNPSQQDTKPDASLDNQAVSNQSQSQQDSKKSLLKGFFKKACFWNLSYYFVAQNAENCDLFYGLVVDNALVGRASVHFNAVSGCRCHGVAQVTYYPPFAVDCSGQKGYIKLKCNDGRTFKGNFTTTSLTTGNATVTDSLGNQYQCTFGHTVEQAIEKVNVLRRQLGCPEVTVNGVTLEVQGQILKPH